ncbi:MULTISPECIES: hypothetical protein [Halomonas]|uniref:Uncharacterized protein n=2 Tax=Halomonas TaxID=2745 RepID=A0ABQ0U1F7_9GAMM|nr:MULTISPECIES: hypothetical protein [Halomonas]PSJ23802.1 hypothetical protein CVH10_02825 [Halomonas sp. ND22Bw]KGE76806.1 hypothetical protein FP66_14390 [Halomonas salina]MDR5888081.1 hypothetical protein [Halomonas salina]RAH37392.1 hypothetical protein C9J49_010830 [Halomonas sp. SL1]WJY08605.1 hypothetical protein QWG60_06785 [Halomonas halophila]
MFKPTILLMATALTLPSLAMGDTLSLPADARVAMALVDDLTLDAETPRLDDVVMHPVHSERGSHRLPDYCVVTGDARRNGERVRLTASALTCIETAGADSAIYSGELTAGAYDADGDFGLAACQGDRCRLTPDDVFVLTLTRPLSLEQQANPSAEINARRRQHDADEAADQP